MLFSRCILDCDHDLSLSFRVLQRPMRNAVEILSNL